MTSSARPKLVPPPSECPPVSDVALLLPWYAMGTLSPQDRRRVAAALARDPKLATNLIAVRAEQAESSVLGEACGRPSLRPMQALFAAIDAETSPARANVTRLRFEPARTELVCDVDAVADIAPKKIRRRR